MIIIFFFKFKPNRTCIIPAKPAQADEKIITGGACTNKYEIQFNSTQSVTIKTYHKSLV